MTATQVARLREDLSEESVQTLGAIVGVNTTAIAAIVATNDISTTGISDSANTAGTTVATTNNGLYTVTVPYTALQNASLGKLLTVATIPVGAIIQGVVAETTETFTGGDISAVTLVVGLTGGATNDLILSHSVFTAAITKGLLNADLGTIIAKAGTQTQFGWMPAASKAVTMTFAGTATLSTFADLATGSIKLHIRYTTWK